MQESVKGFASEYWKAAIPAATMLIGVIVSMGTLRQLGERGRLPLSSLAERKRPDMPAPVGELAKATKALKVHHNGWRWTLDPPVEPIDHLVPEDRSEFIFASREESLRFVWIGALVFQLGLMVALPIYCAVLVYKHTGEWIEKPGRRRKLAGWSALASVLFGVFVYFVLGDVGEFAPLHQLFLVLAFVETENLRLGTVPSYLNGWGGGIGFFVTMVVVLIVAKQIELNRKQAEPAGGMRLEEIHERNRELETDFRRLLFASAAFLVAVTFQIFCEFSWPSALFNDVEVSGAIKSMATAASFAYGSIFTVIAGFIFTPAMLMLGNGPRLNTKTLSELLAILAPLFAAIPLAKLFG